jgi:hypothetical protein
MAVCLGAVYTYLISSTSLVLLLMLLLLPLPCHRTCCSLRTLHSTLLMCFSSVSPFLASLSRGAADAAAAAATERLKAMALQNASEGVARQRPGRAAAAQAAKKVAEVVELSGSEEDASGGCEEREEGGGASCCVCCVWWCSNRYGEKLACSHCMQAR